MSVATIVLAAASLLAAATLVVLVSGVQRIIDVLVGTNQKIDTVAGELDRVVNALYRKNPEHEDLYRIAMGLDNITQELIRIRERGRP